MSDEVIELDSYRPHYVFSCQCEGENHGVAVVPDAWLQGIARGDPTVAPLPPCLLRIIVGEWLDLNP